MNDRFQTMPPLSTEERDALERSIRTFGVEVPIVVDENGTVIDGHHRKEIAEHLGIECPEVVEAGLSEEQKVALSISLNIDRRQVTREQKRAIVAASIKAEPQASNREHARRVGVSDNTVAAVRQDLEESAQVAHFSERVDPRTGNASQPASKPRPVAPVVPVAEADEPDIASITASLREQAAQLRGFVEQGIAGGAWRVLGYPSWQAWLLDCLSDVPFGYIEAVLVGIGLSPADLFAPEAAAAGR